MERAETIVGDASQLGNLSKWVSGEFNNITKYLQRLIGTNHPMLETAKRCTYIGEGRMGSAQARGLTVILTAKAIEGLTSGRSEAERERIVRDQISLAEMSEMTYSAYMIHRGVMDLKMHGLEQVDFVRSQHNQEQFEFEVAQKTKGLHYGNKVSVLCGDFLLAYVMRGLGDLFSSKAVDLVASAITDFMEGEFLLLDDWRSQNYLYSEESRDFKRWQRRTNSSIGSLQGNTCQATLVLAGIEGEAQLHAQEFGKNLGLAWQAHTELQPFLEDSYEPIKLPDMPAYPSFDLNSLPVLIFLRNSYETNPNFRLLVNDIKGAHKQRQQQVLFDGKDSLLSQHYHQEAVDYARLHELVLSSTQSIKETNRIIENYCRIALQHLDKFPSSEAKQVLRNICESLAHK